jgi:hypothetical protein
MINCYVQVSATPYVVGNNISDFRDYGKNGGREYCARQDYNKRHQNPRSFCSVQSFSPTLMLIMLIYRFFGRACTTRSNRGSRGQRGATYAVRYNVPIKCLAANPTSNMLIFSSSFKSALGLQLEALGLLPNLTAT